ncbi:LysR substrate-binding domain-containing protein [Streptomyces sp. NPDC048338]|uniref:LysR substrate-binding domain-containing protein n=1 Tax=Streptomyces sp. NPDC048338 TaxID=3365536 RepID=UPI0037242B82
MLPYARAALAAADAVRETLADFTGLLRGRVTFGLVSCGTGHAFDVAGLLAGFHTAHPAVEIALTEDTSARMLAAVRAGELDIALVGLAEPDPPAGLSLRLVIDEPLVAAVAADDPLAAGSGPLPVAALRDRRLICLPRGTGVRGVLERICAGAGFSPQVAFEAAAPQLPAQLAARGLGVAVVPALSEAAAAAFGLRTRPLDEPRARGRVTLAWRTEGPASPAARALLDVLRDALPVPADPHPM